MPAPEFWTWAESEIGHPISPEVKKYFRLNDWGEVQDPDFIETLRKLERAGLGGTDYEPIDTPRDERWRLIADLNTAYLAETDPETDDRQWLPVTLEPLLSLDTRPPSMSVRITFDHRISLDALVKALRKTWPDLKRRGWVRRTRTLGDRSLALLRFICLEAPRDTTWRARMQGWNEAHPNWEFSNDRAFNSAFHRAERQLTGEKFSLDWFHDSIARLEADELLKLYDQEPRARQAVHRAMLVKPDRTKNSEE